MDEEAAHTQPTWFGPETAPLYGVVHVPAGRRARGGIVICPPLGKEHVDTYRGLKLLAQELCARGFMVLRFDYRATGDSAGELGADSALSDYQDSIRTAVRYLRSAGVTQIGVVGLRMGAMLAATVGSDLDGLAALVLWDPVLDGRRYLREQRTLYKMTVGADRIDVERESILGTTFSPECARQLKGIQMPESLGVAVPTLIVARPERADEPTIKALLGNGNCELATVAGQPEYVEPVTFVVQIPVATLTLIAEWLHHAMDDTSREPVSPVIARRAQVAQLPDGRAVVETLDELGPNRLFAIRTALADAPSDTPTLLIHNTACEHRVGSGRVWTDTARELATHGLAAVRYDRRGTGDTGWATAEFATIYSPESNTDVHDAMVATGIPAERLMMTGICSGAWNSAIGAIRYGARAVVLVNAILFSVRHKAIGPEKLIGMTPPNPGVEPAPEPRTFEARVKKLIRRWLPYQLWLLMGRLGLTEVPEVLLTALGRQGVVVDMVMSPEDQAWFDKQRGPQGVARLERRGWAPTITRAPSGDHPLLQRDIQNVASARILAVAQREFAELLPESVGGDVRHTAWHRNADPPASCCERG
ncbi:serine aminopeptidase domain-containing protein [Mycobacterium sp. SMC-13]|uniref:serine aminopeptidase domain-containing protein n=1 Tax=Mycobacterium sp. SMC-13 TaxID=3381626 RepID=UPI003877051D